MMDSTKHWALHSPWDESEATLKRKMASMSTMSSCCSRSLFLFDYSQKLLELMMQKKIEETKVPVQLAIKGDTTDDKAHLAIKDMQETPEPQEPKDSIATSSTPEALTPMQPPKFDTPTKQIRRTVDIPSRLR